MINEATKTCNLCGEVVAKKYGLFFTTTCNYVTLREDSPPRRFDGRETVRGQIHICAPCWIDIENAVEEARLNRRKADG